MKGARRAGWYNTPSRLRRTPPTLGGELKRVSDRSGSPDAPFAQRAKVP